MEIINFKPLLPGVNKPSINTLLIPNPIGVSNNIGSIDANPLLQLRNVSETNKQAESITQPFLMNDNQIKYNPIIRNSNGIKSVKDNESSPFIIANSQEISLDQLCKSSAKSGHYNIKT
ncbi:hypothetical protein [Elizabethkingia anophelis]|uniref:hypothetical protein n=1 Tax=Elizabethkingia anophelis TaxID=1117645 RepID=UPI0016244CD7|nr:hypothetical protein [Elizabethkingia anophelis]